MNAPIVIVGGGLGGLACATLLARQGHQVHLFERASHVGGRAVTQVREGFHLNLGPHALYAGGRGIGVLRALGVPIKGRAPLGSGGVAVRGGTLHGLPSGFVSLLTTSLFTLAEKLEAARFLANAQSIDVAPLRDTPLRTWVESRFAHRRARDFMYSIFRVASYCNEPDRQSAGAAISQFTRAAKGGVLYLDGGWQSLVGGLAEAAGRAGVVIRTHASVASVLHDAQARGVVLESGEQVDASAVILAVSPRFASAIAPRISALRAWADAAVPVRAACLDVALETLPSQTTFALGIDVPSYVSVHSAVASLAPRCGAMVHVARYLAEGETATAAELASDLERIQPGYRRFVRHERFLPNLMVANDFAEAGRATPGPEVPGVRGLYVVGDWASSEGMLADASLASAKRVSELASRHALAGHATDETRTQSENIDGTHDGARRGFAHEAARA